MIDSPEVEVVLPRQLIGSVATVWMFGVVVYLGTQVWSALNIGRRFGFDGPDSDKWVRMTFLSQTGGLQIALGALAGLVLVAIAGPARARAASVLGIAIGLWTAIAGALGVIVAFHRHNALFISSLTDNRFVFGLANAASIVLGVVVVVLGARLLTAGGGLTDTTELEVAELS